MAKWAEERVIIVIVANVGRRMVFGSKKRREQMRKREKRTEIMRERERGERNTGEKENKI